MKPFDILAPEKLCPERITNMSVRKVLGTVASCGECPNHSYYSGGVYQCSLVEEAVLDKTIIAPFCPLPDYPSRTIAEMQMTIIGLRQPLKYGFGVTLMSHVASRLNRTLHVSGAGLTISFKDEEETREVYLDVPFIRNIGVRPFEIMFIHKGKIFKLFPDANPPLLHEAADDTGERWYHHNLVV